ncbi:copper resistance protein CopC [Paenibacillus sp. EC2-1]|uniref:copper resistance CopC family protein n=1 Tax=Paenibacillus sp. EC2-1 TaxID=3388665 RepID=UPI003BEF0E0C
MFKPLIMFLAMLLVFAFPAGTWAHSKLQSSIPAANSTETEAVQQLSLSFNEKIDSTLSTLTITNDKGEKIDATEVKIENSEMKATLGSPLESGSYTVEWKIVGLDGHPVKGNYAFQVDAPVTTPEADQDSPVENPGDNGENSNTAVDEPTDSNQEQPSDTSNDSEQQPADTDNTPAEQSQASTDATESGSGTTLWVVLIVALVAIGGFFALKQSRKRR